MKTVYSTCSDRSVIDSLSRVSLKLFAVVVVVYLLLVPFIPEIQKISDSTGIRFSFFTWFLLLFICKLREYRANKRKEIDWIIALIFFILCFSVAN